MTNEEAGVKMAEIMGWSRVEKDEYYAHDWYSAGDWMKGSGDDIQFMFQFDWNPEKNIAQMLEVINVISSHYMISKIGDRYKCYIYEDGFPSICLWKEEGITFQQAMFQAVKKYMEKVEG